MRDGGMRRMGGRSRRRRMWRVEEVGGG